MKKLKLPCLLLSILMTLFSCSFSVYAAELVPVEAKSCILIEASTGLVIYENNADEVLSPASITKIMTMLLIFDALKEGSIQLTDEVCISEYAASMGGSQVFLEPGEIQTVEALIKCIAIASANDASVAMAEYISGTEAAFVEKMNSRAKDLGMLNTNFVNCCGLDTPGHVTTARDVAYMSRELITKYPEVHKYSTTWMDTITHTTRRGSSEFGLTNTNKLIKQYEWATGLKTGSTSQAGFCLSATANKNDIELIAVVMKSTSGKSRVSDCISLLNYGYSLVNRYEDSSEINIPAIKVKGGTTSYVKPEISESFSFVYLNKEDWDISKIERKTEIIENVTAPIKEGDAIGLVNYSYDGRPLGSIQITAKEDIPKAGYGFYLKSLIGIR